MGCELSDKLVFPFVDGALVGAAHRRFARHLAGCPDCREAAEASRALCRTLRTLPDPVLAPAQAEAFDRAVFARLGFEEAARPRERAARAVSVAARSRLRQRRFEPLFAPLPSLIMVCVALAAASVGLAVQFGDLVIRALGGGLVVAADSVWTRAMWMAEGAFQRLVDTITLAEVARSMFSEARPWFEAARQYAAAHGQETALIAALGGSLVLGLLWRLARARRAGARSS